MSTDVTTMHAGPHPPLTMPEEFKLDDAKPDEAKADDGKPDEAKPDEAKPDEAKTEEAKADEAKADEAKADDAKTDEAKTDEAKTDEAKADDAKTDEAKTDEAKTDEAKADEAKADEPPPPSRTGVTGVVVAPALVSQKSFAVTPKEAAAPVDVVDETPVPNGLKRVKSDLAEESFKRAKTDGIEPETPRPVSSTA
jgi:hypothetical protein